MEPTLDQPIPDAGRRRFVRTAAAAAGAVTLGVASTGTAAAGVSTANGWYEEEIYYIDHGIEESVTERGENDIFLIGGNRVWQAQVVEFIPGEPGCSPHWNVNVVHTAAGVTVTDIANSSWASDLFVAPDYEVLFDDAADIKAARDAGLVTITKPGVVVLCPIISERGAEFPGNEPLSEDFPRPWPATF